MDITNLHIAHAASELSEIESHEHPAALEDILKQTLADANDKANFDKASIAERLINPANASNPKNLVALQTEVSDYNINISLASTLTRKAVSAVETLVKGQ